MPETGIWLSDYKQRNISICQIHGGMQEWSHTVWAVGLQGLQDLVIWKFCISWWSVSSAGAGILQALQELVVFTLCRSCWSARSAGAGGLYALQELLVWKVCRSWWSARSAGAGGASSCKLGSAQKVSGRVISVCSSASEMFISFVPLHKVEQI